MKNKKQKIKLIQKIQNSRAKRKRNRGMKKQINEEKKNI